MLFSLFKLFVNSRHHFSVFLRNTAPWIKPNKTSFRYQHWQLLRRNMDVFLHCKESNSSIITRVGRYGKQRPIYNNKFDQSGWKLAFFGLFFLTGSPEGQLPVSPCCQAAFAALVVEMWKLKSLSPVSATRVGLMMRYHDDWVTFRLFGYQLFCLIY